MQCFQTKNIPPCDVLAPSKYVKKTLFGKGLIKLKHISSFCCNVARTYSIYLESSQTFKMKLFSKMS